MKKREPRNLQEHLAARAAVVVRKDETKKAGFMDLLRGMPLAGRMGEFIVWWTTLSREEGSPLTVARYIELSGDPPRTVYHWLGEFREMFPEFGERGTPQVFADHLNRKAYRERELDEVDVTPVLARAAS